MTTIGTLARSFGLSRSTLLYYDRIGVFRASLRGDNGYRHYSDEDVRRLELICSYRRAGLPLKEIRTLLEAPESDLVRALERRLGELDKEIQGLREQQGFILGILKSDASHLKVGIMTKERWTELLRASGFSEQDMDRWHVEFERHAPEKHDEFLRFLCLSDPEIQRIREWSRSPQTEPTD